jgi:hypothetical protein
VIQLDILERINPIFAKAGSINAYLKKQPMALRETLKASLTREQKQFRSPFRT